ncbi:MAG: RNA polymerase sigma factor [Candidatus Sulfotelmatobacter sp.]
MTSLPAVAIRCPPDKRAHAASNVSTFVLPKKFLNKAVCWTVFMFEGKRVVAGEAILSGVTTINRSGAETSDSEQTDAVLALLVRQYSRLVYRIAYAVLRRHHDAEDATQETFLRVLRYSPKLASVDDPKTWLARIAWRVAIDRSRHLKSKGEIPLDDPEQPRVEIADSGTRADDSLHGAQIATTVTKLIAALPAKLREPLILSTIEEMSPKEVAATLRINEAAVRSRVFRARQILKEKLSQTLNRKW